MAPRNTRESSIPSVGSARPSAHQLRAYQQPSRSPSASFGSDKENAGSRSRTSLGKRKSTAGRMSTSAPGSIGNKRRRLEEKGKAPASQSARRKEISTKVDDTYYDPDQDEETKRTTLKKYRQLNSNLGDSRAEFLQRDHRGIQDTITEADNLIKDVKQTSTATVDSRLLVEVGDLAYRKINTMTLGDHSTGIDVDDFLSKCINFMRLGPCPLTSTQPPTSTQRRQTNDRHHGSDNEDEEREPDLNWAHLGRTLCFPASRRPCLSSFLLGPLSLQKKQRAPTQRRATQRTNNEPNQPLKPLEVDQETLDKQESASLTVICSQIATLLQRAQDDGEANVEKDFQELVANNSTVSSSGEIIEYEPSGDEVRALMRKHNVAQNGGIPLVNFCVNPKSFGQTVENLFYVSFLVKEGKVGFDQDENGFTTLSMMGERTVKERQETQRNQAVLTIDFDVWEELVENFDIKKSVIPHREAQDYEKDDGVIVESERRRERSRTSQAGPSSSAPRGPGRDEEVSEDEDLYG